MSVRPMLLAASLALAVATLVGCGGQRADPPPTMGKMVTNLKELLAEYQKQHDGKAPNAIADFGELGNSFDGGMWTLRTNKVIYIWGAPLTPAGHAVIAYEAQTPESGGEVLLEDGTVKSVTTAEFAAAPKATGTAKK